MKVKIQITKMSPNKSNLNKITNPVLQVFVFLTTGLSLIYNSSETKNENFVFSVGIILCVYAIINVLLAIIFPSVTKKMETFDTNLKTGLLPLTILTVFISVLKLSGNAQFELGFILMFCFATLAIIWMFFSIIRINGFNLKIAGNKKALFYKIFSRLGVISVLLGLFLVFYGVFDPETTKQLIEMNEWAYNPLIYFATAIVCVFPILILDP